MAVVPEGREAISEITLLEKDSLFSLAQVKPKTGGPSNSGPLRHLGSPVLGDSLYGFAHMNEKFQIPRHFLHAYRAVLPHPISKKVLSIEAPLPSDMKDFLLKRAFSSV